MSRQYVVCKDDKYIGKENQLTSSLSRAKIYSKKDRAKSDAKNFSAEVITVYISLRPPQTKTESVWLVEKVCQVRGLSVYGPFFSKKEAEEIFTSLRDKITSEVEDWQSLFTFTEISWGYATNKLHDSLTIRETRRCVDT